MAATILAKDVLYRASVQLTDAPSSTDQFVRWSEKELVAWLNDGQRVIAKYLPASCSRIDVIRLATGTRQSIETVQSTHIKHGDGTTAATQRGKILLDIIRNMGDDGLTAGRSIRVVGRELLDAGSPDWHEEAGTEILEFTYDIRTPKYFYTYPGVAAGETVWVEISWLVNPVEVAYVADSMRISGGSTTVISIDDQYVDDLVNYMLARGHMKDAEAAGNLNLASAHVNIFTSSINAQAMVLTGVNPNLKTLPLTPQILAASS
jgi:hypothetical protein